MIIRQEPAEPASFDPFQHGNHFGGVEIVLRSWVLALEEELEVGGEVRHPLVAAEHGLWPRDADGRITAEDPELPISFADRDVDAPRLFWSSSTPYVVLTRLSEQRGTLPRSEDAGGGNLDIPTREHLHDCRSIVSKYAHVDVIVGSPRSVEVQLQGASTAYPPTRRKLLEETDHLSEIERHPDPESVACHCRRIVTMSVLWGAR